jgi:hypothetical protein
MTVSTRWLVAPLLVGVVAFPAFRTRPEPECVVAQRWVQAHFHSLPATLDAISQHRFAYRKAIFTVLSRETKVRLWHEQLRYYANSPRLNGDQRAFVAEMDARLDDSFGMEHAEVHKRYGARARLVLGSSLAREIFTNLGVSTPEMNLPRASSSTSLTGCNCSRGDDWCDPSGLPCGSSGCTTSQSGCGWWWCQPCDGECNGMQQDDD